MVLRLRDTFDQIGIASEISFRFQTGITVNESAKIQINEQINRGLDDKLMIHISRVNLTLGLGFEIFESAICHQFS